jgi:hypothetical protein
MPPSQLLHTSSTRERRPTSPASISAFNSAKEGGIVIGAKEGAN